MQTQHVSTPASPRPRAVIFGTDWHTDCDDAVAVRVLAWAQWKGLIRLLGVSIDSAMACSVSSMKAFLEEEQLAGVPVALDHSAFDYGGPAAYQPRLAAGRDREKENREAEESVRMYRRLLAGAEAPVDLIEVGFSQVLAALLLSEPDDLSPLSGEALVASRVGRLWMMGGKWDSETVPEFNFSKTEKARHAIHTVVEKCPVPITFLGFEVAVDILSGTVLNQCTWDDALRTVLSDYGASDGRPSWDPLLTYLACIGDPERVGFRCVCGTASIDPESGCNRLTPNPKGPHCYVVKQQPNSFYRETLDALLLEYSKHLAESKQQAAK